MAVLLSVSEWQTLSEISDPDICLIRDGDNIAHLIAKSLILFQGNCYRPTWLGLQYLRQRERPLPLDS